MKTIQWFVLCVVALFAIPTVNAQEVIEESNDNITTVIEEAQTHNAIYMSEDELFDTVKEYNKAEYIEINSFMMGMAKMMAPREERAFLNKIKTMRIIDLTPCSEADKARFAEFISTVELTSFDPGVDEFDDDDEDEDEDEKMRIYIKIKGETVTCMVVASWGEKDCTLIQLNGKMSISDLEAVANGAGSSVI
ncbi:MAG: DUF4252 domain-containing protein [Bacteroidaceae bacterium]|nr:DUF4252 domain-containing protein [Bacteroidaceae bacterium]